MRRNGSGIRPCSVAALRLNLSTKEDLQRKCGALFVFTGERSGAQLVLLQFCFRSGFGGKVLSHAASPNSRLVFISFFVCVCVCR